MKRKSIRRRCWRGVYYIPLLVLAAVLGADAAGAQVELTVTPAMTRGPVGAPVVIVAFSDYQ